MSANNGTQVIPYEEVGEIDISSMDFTLDEKYKSQEGYKIFESQLFIALGDAQNARERIAYHIHMILLHDLWAYERNEFAKRVFLNQEEYLTYLAGRNLSGFAVSTLKAYHTALKLAGQLGYDTVEKISEHGLNVFLDISRNVKKDRATGEPVGLKRGMLPPSREIKEYLVETVEEYGNGGGKPDLVLSPRDSQISIDHKLAPGRPRVWFERERNGNGNVRWFFERYDDGAMIFKQGSILVTFSSDSRGEDVPAAVIEELYRKLGVEIFEGV